MLNLQNLAYDIRKEGPPIQLTKLNLLIKKLEKCNLIHFIFIYGGRGAKSNKKVVRIQNITKTL